jgi:hypothetical protein
MPTTGNLAGAAPLPFGFVAGTVGSLDGAACWGVRTLFFRAFAADAVLRPLLLVAFVPLDLLAMTDSWTLGRATVVQSSARRRPPCEGRLTLR